MLVRHLRLSQRKDDTVVGRQQFYCHSTLPATAYQLFLQIILFLDTNLFPDQAPSASGQKVSGEEEALYHFFNQLKRVKI